MFRYGYSFWPCLVICDRYMSKHFPRIHYWKIILVNPKNGFITDFLIKILLKCIWRHYGTKIWNKSIATSTQILVQLKAHTRKKNYDWICKRGVCTRHAPLIYKLCIFLETFWIADKVCRDMSLRYTSLEKWISCSCTQSIW